MFLHAPVIAHRFGHPKSIIRCYSMVAMKPIKMTPTTIDDIDALMGSMKIHENKNESDVIETMDYKKLYLEKCEEVTSLQTSLKVLQQKFDTLADVHKNKGEKDEIMVCHKLRELATASTNDAVELYGDEARNGIQVLDPKTMKAISQTDPICKTPCGYKADVCVRMLSTGNVYSSSVKSTKGAPPAILNHTPRSAKVFSPKGSLHHEIDNLDKIIDEYIQGRNAGKFKEDVRVTNMEWIKNDTLRRSFIECLRYFVFTGTGSGKSKCEANSILTSDENKIRFIKCDTVQSQLDYVSTILEKCVISIRSKGTPAKLTPSNDKYESCMRWGYTDSNGSVKCALHIRIQ